MAGLSKQQALAELRQRIEDIEKRPLLAESGFQPVANQDFLILPPGILHEVFSDAQRDAGAALGFTLAQARSLLTAERPVLLVLQLTREGQDLGIPYGPGLKSFGLDPDSVVLGRMENPVDLLWAMEEAIACRAVAAVIADIGSAASVLDFTVSRRLSLRSAAAGSSAFVIAYGSEREASASRLRWRVLPVVSAQTPFDARAPNGPRWQVQLEKGRLGPRRGPVKWMLDWTENGFVLAEPQKLPRPAAAIEPALSRTLSAALGNRLSKAG